MRPPGDDERRPVAGSGAHVDARQADSRSVLPSRAEVLQSARGAREAGAAAADEAAGEWWRRIADQAIRAIARRGLPFTADDLVDRTGLPEAANPRAMGARFTSAHRDGVIRLVGYAMSRPSCRGAVVRVWQGQR